MAERDERIVAITAAMPAGTGLSGFAQRFPKRFFDVGISEEHAAVFAAGLAAEGLRPVFAVYSTFAQRAVDCIIHDICLQKLPVTICLDRAGIVGDDGPTHHGVFDIALLRCIPNLVIMQPRDEAQLAHMLATAMAVEGASVIRYPRGAGPGAAVPQTPRALPVGQAEEIKPGTGAVIWALGDMQALGEQTVNWLQDRGVDAGLVDPRFVRPLDRDRLRAHLAGGLTVATLENGVLAGGFGSAVREAAAEDGCASQVLAFGWPDTFIPHGAPAVLMERYGLTPEAVGERIAAVAAAPPDGKG
jgi:1-deoxy-D-xylulose-5-phosphate synthase